MVWKVGLARGRGGRVCTVEASKAILKSFAIINVQYCAKTWFFPRFWKTSWVLKGDQYWESDQKGRDTVLPFRNRVDGLFPTGEFQPIKRLVAKSPTFYIIRQLSTRYMKKKYIFVLFRSNSQLTRLFPNNRSRKTVVNYRQFLSG